MSKQSSIVHKLPEASRASIDNNSDVVRSDIDLFGTCSLVNIHIEELWSIGMNFFHYSKQN